MIRVVNYAAARAQYMTTTPSRPVFLQVVQCSYSFQKITPCTAQILSTCAVLQDALLLRNLKRARKDQQPLESVLVGRK